MTLMVYNSLTKRKEIFTPLIPNKINLYVCGVTVYDHCHIGHARTYLAFDVIIRYLRFRGFEVNYVRNITDIDDKIIKRAKENNESTNALVARFTELMHAEFATLNMLSPNHEPKATETIPAMIQMTQSLIDKGFAYPAKNGDVYYRVARFQGYGKLSGQQLDQLRIGERVDINVDKEDPLDFVLWKASKPEEPSWPSPWGPGRPGWHIECSVMAKQAFGVTFDIHAGGSDLRFPHHENEIAQSEAANGCTFARYWLHSGMVRVNAEKMSKSLGNFFVITDVLKQYSAEVVRYFLVSGHYRSEIDYTEDNLRAAHAALTRFYTALRGLHASGAVPQQESFTARFMAAMDDDFNVPEALAVLFDLAREINRLRENNREAAESHAVLLKQLASILGVLQQDPDAFLQADEGVDVAKIEALIAERKQVRSQKNWARADEIRQQLTAMGIVLEDSASGTQWRKE